jgi:hypothetical protein
MTMVINTFNCGYRKKNTTGIKKLYKQTLKKTKEEYLLALSQAN